MMLLGYVNIITKDLIMKGQTVRLHRICAPILLYFNDSYRRHCSPSSRSFNLTLGKIQWRH